MSKMNEMLIVCAEYYEREKGMEFFEAMDYAMTQKLEDLVTIYKKEIAK